MHIKTFLENSYN